MTNCYACYKKQEVDRLRTRVIQLESGEEVSALKKRVAELEAIIAQNSGSPGKNTPGSPNTTQLLIRIDKLEAEVAKRDQRILDLEDELAEKEKQRKEQKKKADNLEAALNTANWKYEKDMKELLKNHKKELEELSQSYEAKLAAKDKEIADLKKLLYDKQAQSGEKDEQGQAGVTRTVKTNSRNSSMPPSQDPNHKTIVSNNRVKSGKPVGGQIGHPFHPRKRHEPDEIIEIAPPQEVIDNPDDYYVVGTITKQRVGLRLVPYVTEYTALRYRNRKTDAYVHGAFPADLGHLEVNYDPSVEATIAWLHSVANMAYNKIHELLDETTDGLIVPSEGMMANLEARFASVTGDKREALAKEMLSDRVMNIDGTFVRVNGKLRNVLVLHTESGTFYKATGVKGEKAVEQTFAGEFHGVTVCDGESTFHKVGDTYQECLNHATRYLKGATEQEPWMTFPQKMHDFLWDVIKMRDIDKASGNTHLDEARLNKAYSKYNQLIALGETEYKEHPPEPSYRKGFTTWKRMKEEGTEHFLLFLTDYAIPWTNNDCEKDARHVKVHSKINGGLRSEDSLGAHCDTMTIIMTARRNEESTMATFEEGFAKAKAEKTGQPVNKGNTTEDEKASA